MLASCTGRPSNGWSPTPCPPRASDRPLADQRFATTRAAWATCENRAVSQFEDAAVPLRAAGGVISVVAWVTRVSLPARSTGGAECPTLDLAPSPSRPSPLRARPDVCGAVGFRLGPRIGRTRPLTLLNGMLGLRNDRNGANRLPGWVPDRRSDHRPNPEMPSRPTRISRLARR